MATLWQILKPEDKVKLANLYQALAGFPFVPPDSSARTVNCETKLEPIEEIDRIMCKVPRSEI